MRCTLLVALVALVALPGAGCLIESAQAPAHPALGPGETVCQDEKPTGSNFTRRVCRTQAQRDDDAAYRQSWINHWPPHPARADTTYPGIDARHPRQ
jgi:hypothetical protein